MALSEIYFGVRDKSNAGNNALNIDSNDVVSLQFDSGTSGDLLLDQVADGPDTDSFPDFDPDTQVLLNGVPHSYSLLLTGKLPTAQNQGAGSVPDDLEGKLVALIKIDINDDGILTATDPQYVFVLDGSGTLELMRSFGNGAVSLTDVNDVIVDPPPVCFCAGTGIATPEGSRLVEDLVAGDSVLTDDGRVVQVEWISTSRHSRRVATFDRSRRPIVIRAHAFGPGLPLRELSVSPQHRIVVEGPECELFYGSHRVFVIAHHLPPSVAYSPEPETEVVYYHLLLDQHYVLLANGLPSESFQPARRSIEALSGKARDSLDATLAVLGEAAMLSRPDALRTLASFEARVLASLLDARAGSPALPKTQVQTLCPVA